ncbi:MAG: hypothetical protein GXY34_12670 [Syntrophomonadaceae bacterium]|nr:hypothetical protein [Syntrophomonadaceae bacterium]
MPALLKYRYTTGPISGSQYHNNIRIVALNNGTKRHSVRIKIYNLDHLPKELVYEETFTVSSKTQIKTEYIPSFELYEVQLLTDSSMVYFWVGGRSGNENLPGNTVLNQELIRF